MIDYSRYRARPGASRRRYGKDGTGRQVYQALHEIMDANDHVVGVGELFTVSDNRPLCGDCRQVVLR